MPEYYGWSNTAEHCGLREDPVLSTMPMGNPVGPGESSARLWERDDVKKPATLRPNSRAGWRGEESVSYRTWNRGGVEV
jgi:hypothetical protein